MCVAPGGTVRPVSLVAYMRTIALTAALAIVAAAPAYAGEPYGKLFGGAVFGSDHDITAVIPGVASGSGALDTDLGYNVGGALGAELSKFFAVESEVAYRSNEISGGVVAGETFDGVGDLNALSFMGNAVLSAPGAGGIVPYAGAGAGAARIGTEGVHDTVFAYQAFGGVKKNFGDKTSAGVEYRYFDAERAALSDTITTIRTEYDSHSVNFVLARKF